MSIESRDFSSKLVSICTVIVFCFTGSVYRNRKIRLQRTHGQIKSHLLTCTVYQLVVTLYLFRKTNRI